jgi:hypothetical protein
VFLILSLLSSWNDVQIQAGHLQLEHVEFDLGSLLESLVDVFSVQCTVKGVELGLDMPGMCLPYLGKHWMSRGVLYSLFPCLVWSMPLFFLRLQIIRQSLESFVSVWCTSGC